MFQRSPRVWIMPIVFMVFGSELWAQDRPFLFGLGRFTAAWAGRPASYDEQAWNHMQNIGVTITGSGLAWVDGEPVQGQYNWDVINYVDWEVDQIRARGMEVKFFLGLTPAWAALYPWLDPHRTPPSEDYVDQFMDFHRFVADRFKGRVKYYFFWNEPNGCSWINDGCSNSNGYPLYTQWLIRCSQAVKEMDPDARIIAGRLDYHAGVTQGYNYIQGMYDHGAGPHIDAIAIHPYDWAGTIHWRAITDTRNTMVANGDAHKPIWITEYGWNSTNYQSTADKMTYVLTELKKPEYHYVELANYLVLNDGAGVENYGFTDANFNTRPAYYAFQNFDKTFPKFTDFSADLTIGPTPLTVQFTDESNLGGATGWHWDFGDGATSTERHPSHTYAQEGTFDVTLTISTSEEDEVIQKADFIRVGSFPAVAFIGGAAHPTVTDAEVINHLAAQGLSIDYYDDEPANRPTASAIASSHDLVICSSTTLSANVAGAFRHEVIPFIFWESSLAWCGNPDDRECLANGPTAVAGHTQLNIVDNAHPVTAGLPLGINTLTTSGQWYSYCTGNVAPGAQVLATVPGNPGAKSIIVADAGATMLDGQPAAEKRAMLYLYDETWSATNALGKQILDNAVSWTLGEVDADFHAADPTSGLVNMSVQFVDVSTGPVTGWHWDFGDGGTSKLRHPCHTYTNPGTYEVTLTVTGPGSSGDSLTRLGYVTVVASIPPDLDADNDVDMDDFGWFQACMSGSGEATTSTCLNADFDGDNDVDHADFMIFAGCLSGAGVEPDPTCVD